jgi:hypothetical protein
MRVQKTTLVAWFLWILTMVCATASFLLRFQINALLLRNVQGTAYLQEQLYWLLLIPALVPAYATVGAIVASRRPGNAVGWLCLSLGLLVSVQQFTWNYAALALEITPGSLPAGQFVAWLANVILLAPLLPSYLPSPPLLLTLLLLIFPNGRFLSCRWRFVAWIAVACACVSTFLTIISPTLTAGLHTNITNPIGIREFGFVANIINILLYVVEYIVFLATITSIFIRWKLARGKERQQLKWLMYMGIVSAATGLLYLLSSYLPLSPYIPVVIGAVCIAGITIGIPVAIGIAMLKHRLYDIDILINRTLVYGILTATLTLIYFGSIILLQILLQGMISQTNDVAIVASTLAIAALFQPFRHHIQNFIDRRFYRRKYDATRTLAAFSATLRNEVDLNQLREQLVAVVEETMQPAFVSLWLCPLDGSTEKTTRVLPKIGD